MDPFDLLDLIDITVSLVRGRRCPQCRARLRRLPKSSEGKPLKCAKCGRVWLKGKRRWLRSSVAPEDKALFEELSRDSSVKIIGGLFMPDDLAASNAYKQELYTAYLNKSPDIVKVFRRKQVGDKGQYTMTYFIVDHGKVKVVTAYFGDPFGSDELQYIHAYTPSELKPGYLEAGVTFMPLPDSAIPMGKELAISYIPSTGKNINWF